MNVAVAETMHVQQVCKKQEQVDPTMTVVASRHFTCPVRVPTVTGGDKGHGADRLFVAGRTQ